MKQILKSIAGILLALTLAHNGNACDLKDLSPGELTIIPYDSIDALLNDGNHTYLITSEGNGTSPLTKVYFAEGNDTDCHLYDVNATYIFGTGITAGEVVPAKTNLNNIFSLLNLYKEPESNFELHKNDIVLFKKQDNNGTQENLIEIYRLNQEGKIAKIFTQKLPEEYTIKGFTFYKTGNTVYATALIERLATNEAGEQIVVNRYVSYNLNTVGETISLQVPIDQTIYGQALSGMGYLPKNVEINGITNYNDTPLGVLRKLGIYLLGGTNNYIKSKFAIIKQKWTGLETEEIVINEEETNSDTAHTPQNHPYGKNNNTSINDSGHDGYDTGQDTGTTPTGNGGGNDNPGGDDSTGNINNGTNDSGGDNDIGGNPGNNSGDSGNQTGTDNGGNNQGMDEGGAITPGDSW